MLEQIFTTDDLVRDPLKGANSPMREFYRGKIVFLTGGTGFLGKLFIEKLVRCEVREIVLLIRGKKGRTPRERLQRQLEREAIYVGYSKNPDLYWNKLRIMEGALEHEELNLSEIDIDYLQNNVNVVIHSAADVSLDVSLKITIKANVFGANELLKIALGMKHLVCFLYISTAYSNCTQEVIDEKFYDVAVDPMTMVRLAEMADERQLDALSRKIIQPWPNTYTYAKVMAENVIRAYSSRLPVALIRPSIVVSTVEEPIEGWTDNVYGLNGVVVGCGSGVLRVLHVYDEYHVDIMPADLVVNSSLAVMWYTTVKQSEVPPDGNVFNCTSRTDNPFTFRNVYDFSLLSRGKIPAMQTLWYPVYNPTNSATVYYVLQFFYHVIPAFFFDLLARLNGMEPKVLYLYRKVRQFADVLDFFTTNEWTFTNDRMRLVYDSMEPDDKEFFPADVKTVNWSDFFQIYLLGLRRYIVRESLDNLEQAKKKYRKMKVAHFSFLGLVYMLMGYLGFVVLKNSPVRHGFEKIGDMLQF